jgi:ABC-type glycerol-3-phosphate transport system permease component
LATSESAAVAPRRSRRLSPRARRRAGSFVRHAVLLAFSALALFPIYFMVVNSLKTSAEYAGNAIGPPHHLVVSTLHAALAGGDLYRWLLNSLLITAASVLISTSLAALAAYPISLMKWRPGPVVIGVLIALMVVPPIVLIIPLFQLVVDAHQLNTYRSVIVIYTGLMLPFSTFLLASFFGTVPHSLVEAARMDGAGIFRIFRSVLLPLARPALMTVVIVQALWVWNEVLIAIVFLQQQSLRTLMVGLTVFKSRYHLDVPLVMAGMLWATVPMVILYLAGQRFFIRGLTAGAVKG